MFVTCFFVVVLKETKRNTVKNVYTASIGREGDSLQDRNQRGFLRRYNTKGIPRKVVHKRMSWIEEESQEKELKGDFWIEEYMGDSQESTT